MTPLQIAIDGPVASGKGEIAARCAIQFHLFYIYTGALYRALALACIQDGAPLKDTAKVMDVLSRHTIDLVPPETGSERSYCVRLDNLDVTERIFKQDIAQGSSDVATIPEVRQFMVRRQRELARDRAVVMEGRDIGLRVLPDAQLKIYLTASSEERAGRRLAQFEKAGIKKTLEEVLTDTMQRDVQDTSRAADPLQKLPDSWELDTTGLTPEEAMDRIKEELIKRKLI